MQVSYLGWEDPLLKVMASHSVFLAGDSYGQRNLAGQDRKESDMTEATQH